MRIVFGLCIAAIVCGQVGLDQSPGDFSIRLSEGFATAFRSAGGLVSLTSRAGAQTSGGTHFIIRFSNIPTGIRLEVPSEVRSATLCLQAEAESDKVITENGSVVYYVVETNPSLVEWVVIPVLVHYQDRDCGFENCWNLRAVHESGLEVVVLVTCRLASYPERDTLPVIMNLAIDRREQLGTDILPRPEPVQE